MSSKLSVKQNKKDRPKSSDRLKGKKRDGTPEKSATPSQEAQDENRPPSRQIIWDEELEKLQIKAEELDKVRAPHPPGESPKPLTTTKVTVRKLKPAAELNKLKTISVTVAKPAPADAPLKPVDYSGYAGPRYDVAGRVIPYSILGTYENYRREATERGVLLDIPTPRIDVKYRGGEGELTVKYEKKRKRLADITTEENRALRNWQLKMVERKRQQGYISKLLQKAPEDLVMNQGDGYRKIQEDRYLVDRTLPYHDYGKGHRVGSEFWKQQERFGDELAGVHMTLTQAEQGYPPPVEHVGLSSCVKREKGITWEPEYSRPAQRPWHQTAFLQQRHKQLQEVMNELDPHKPDFVGLQVIGTNDPRRRREDVDLKSAVKTEEDNDGYITMDTMTAQQKLSIEEDSFHEYPDVRPPPIFGPAVQFAGQEARWTGDCDSMVGQVGIEARVAFEAYSGTRVTSYLEVVNIGTTSVFFDWKKLPKENPFDLVQPQAQRFYFNNSSGVVLPGETLRVPFVFKSESAGVYTDQWLMETRPVLCGGAALVVTLRGVALLEDKFQAQREKMERDLAEQQCRQIVRSLVDELVNGIRTPTRARSPVDSYITEEQIFQRNNPGLFYRHEAVEEMKQIHQQLLPEEEKASAVWDLCVLDLRDLIMELEDVDERKETFLQKLNALTARLTFVPHQPVSQFRHNICHKLLAEAIDSIVTQSAMIRQSLGLPVREMGELLEDCDSKKGKATEKSAKPEPPGKDGKDKKAAGKDTKDAKPGKGGKEKEPPKPDPKAKPAITPSGAKKAGPTTRAPGGGSGVPEPRTSTPTSPPPSDVPLSQEHEQALEKKYLQKFYTRAFVILGDKMEHMDHVFQEQQQPHKLYP